MLYVEIFNENENFMKISFILFIHLRVKVNFIFYMDYFFLSRLIKADTLISYDRMLHHI